MSYVFAPEPTVGVPVVDDSQLFPVRRVYCVGRNYAEHAREMGFDPEREPPFFFAKPAGAVIPVAKGATLTLDYPAQTDNYHYEIELVVAIGKAGAEIDVGHAREHIFGYAVGLDMTRRDLQLQMRKAGRPWEIGKAFDRSAPIGPLHPAAALGDLPKAAIWLQVNGSDHQRSTLGQLIWSVPEVIAQLSLYFELHPGDLIYTGTPAGVGAVVRGDRMIGGIDGLGELQVEVR